MTVELFAIAAIAAVGQVNSALGESNATLIWVAIFSFTIPSVIAAVTGAIATHRTGPHSTMQTDLDYMKRLLIEHVENRRIHQRRDKRDG